MVRLASPIDEILPSYDAVVVGSGYGGGVAASRLARSGRSVCVLERGREFLPGDFPDTELEALGEFQVDAEGTKLGSPTGLYDLRVNRELNVFVGCGLGGTSLVNANVSLSADPRVFDDERWPSKLRADLPGLRDGESRAREMLRPVRYPGPALRKLEALEKSATGVTGNFARPPINVNFDEHPGGTNHVGLEQRPCILCGDCVSGCNHTSKNTTVMNYLPDACRHGARIFTEASVRTVVPAGDGRWNVRYQILDAGREAFAAGELTVNAAVVVLAAGTLGSTEILLRSRKAGLSTSGQLGTRFTGNGDVLGFAYNCDEEINAVGFGNDDPEDREPVGPCITGIIDRRGTDDLEHGMVIEEGAAPGPLGSQLPLALSAAAKTVGRDTDGGIGDAILEKGRELASLVRGPNHGAIRNTQVFLVMSHDDAAGRIVLEDDRARVEWPGVGGQGGFQRVDEALLDATRPLGGTFVKNPIWSEIMGHDLVTVHPLGGCAMGEDASAGVTDHTGRVFAGNSGTAVHEGLYVCDGSVIPRSVGVNPLLTISAIAERNVAILAAERNWTIDYDAPGQPLVARAETPGIQFTESMVGFFSTSERDDPRRGAELGRAEGSSMRFILTVATEDARKLVDEPDHRAQLVGTVEAPTLSPEPMTATQGRFQLLVQAGNPRVREMRYALRMRTADGRSLYFEGFKTVRDDPGPDVWRDTTTLYVTVWEGDDATGPVVGTGILRIEPADFLRQMTTMKVTGVETPKERLAGVADFGRHFAGALFDVYGGVLAPDNVFDPEAPPRRRRTLRTTAPEVHYTDASDGVSLRLTRYRGGDRGPVMLTHGLGVSSRIFSLDTIETNLVEFLFGRGFDVWLLDYRSSIELPASRSQHTGDEVARLDYPAAVAEILRLTGKPDLQIVAHCFGATTFFMAMLAGLQGVRSAVVSQIATDVVAPGVTRIKSGLYMPNLLAKLGVDSLTAYVDTHANWFEKLYDESLRVLPGEAEERCHSRVCRRITFMYAPLYEHDQLNRQTHATLHETFGIANTAAFEHLALLVREGHLVDSRGNEAYMPHLDRLAIPIHFIHGSENACFLPKSTELTVERLSRANDPRLYSRDVIPRYGHIDCIMGTNAVRDVFPRVARHLEDTG